MAADGGDSGGDGLLVGEETESSFDGLTVSHFCPASTS